MSLVARRLRQVSASSTIACSIAGHRPLETHGLAGRQPRTHLNLNQAGDGIETARGVVDAFEPETADVGNRRVYGQGSVVTGGRLVAVAGHKPIAPGEQCGVEGGVGRGDGLMPVSVSAVTRAAGRYE